MPGSKARAAPVADTHSHVGCPFGDPPALPHYGNYPHSLGPFKLSVDAWTMPGSNPRAAPVADTHSHVGCPFGDPPALPHYGNYPHSFGPSKLSVDAWTMPGSNPSGRHTHTQGAPFAPFHIAPLWPLSPRPLAMAWAHWALGCS